MTEPQLSPTPKPAAGRASWNQVPKAVMWLLISGIVIVPGLCMGLAATSLINDAVMRALTWLALGLIGAAIIAAFAQVARSLFRAFRKGRD